MDLRSFRRTMSVVDPMAYLGKTIFHGEIPYRVIHLDGKIATCQELTNEEAMHLQHWLLAWSKAVRVVEE
jgi:hypothetical protein